MRALAPPAVGHLRPATRARRLASGAVKERSLIETASNAAAAVMEVSAAVRERGVDAPDASKSFVARGEDTSVVDEEGLPLVYDREAIQAFWAKRPGELQRAWPRAPAVACRLGALICRADASRVSPRVLTPPQSAGRSSWATQCPS